MARSLGASHYPKTVTVWASSVQHLQVHRIDPAFVSLNAAPNIDDPSALETDDMRAGATPRTEAGAVQHIKRGGRSCPLQCRDQRRSGHKAPPMMRTPCVVNSWTREE